MTVGASGYTHIDVLTIVKETAKAFLVRLTDKREVWIPRSVVANADDYEEGDGRSTISVRDWFAEKEQLS